MHDHLSAGTKKTCYNAAPANPAQKGTKLGYCLPFPPLSRICALVASSNSCSINPTPPLEQLFDYNDWVTALDTASLID